MENKVMRYLPLYRGPRDFGDPWAFGYRLPFFCDRCQAPRTASLTRLADQDGVGLFYTCDMCGSDRIGPHDDPKPYRRTRSKVYPSVVCTRPGCNYHEFITLG